MQLEGEFTRPNVTYSYCQDCNAKDSCEKARKPGDDVMILSKAFRLILRGELKNAELIFGQCEETKSLVIHDKGYAPEFSTEEQLGLHDMRISDGLNVLELDFDHTWDAVDAPLAITLLEQQMRAHQN